MNGTRDFQRRLLLDYRYIADAQDFYLEKDYEPIAIPWVIGIDSYTSTLPPRVEHYATLGGFLVGSAEQSFIQLMADGEELGRVQAASPCFRSEDHDELHSPYFFKLELFDNTLEMTEKNVLAVLDDARGFFEKHIETEISQESEKSWDIVSKANGIELGSYGIRSYKSNQWIYGTGVALPRLQQAIALAEAN